MGLTPPEVEAWAGHDKLGAEPKADMYAVAEIFTVFTGHAHMVTALGDRFAKPLSS